MLRLLEVFGAQPLVSEEASYRIGHLIVSAKVQWVFNEFLLPEHQSLLEERYLEKRTLQEMGDERGISHTSVLARLKTAEQDFKRVLGEHLAEAPIRASDL